MNDQTTAYRSKIVFANIVGGMRSIIDTMDELGMQVHADNRVHIALVDNEVPINSGQPFPVEYETALLALWQDENVRKCYERAYEFALPENMP